MMSPYFRPAVAFHHVSLLILMTVAALSSSIAAAGDGPTGAPPGVDVGQYTLSGPFVHNNLTVYLILGPDQKPARHYLTLQEALDRKLITIYETGSVNELQIENASADQDVYVQSGDIVKGGRQDRAIAMDFVCPPKTKLPIDAFCVEHGRWSGRGSEPTTQFSSSSYQLAGNALKVAAKGAEDQGEVWRQVQVLQIKASSNAGENVMAQQSASSLQLSLENKKLDDLTDAYVKVLVDVAASKPDAVGCAFAVNGAVRSADIYGSHELFAKLWPKLLKASAVEAIADLQKGKIFETIRAEAVKACMEDAAKGKLGERKVTDRVQMVTRESQDNLVYETRDQKAVEGSRATDIGWIHRSYLVKDEETKAALAARERAGQMDRANGREQPMRQQRAIPASNDPPANQQPPRP
jgi:hypothetical protein